MINIRFHFTLFLLILFYIDCFSFSNDSLPKLENQLKLDDKEKISYYLRSIDTLTNIEDIANANIEISNIYLTSGYYLKNPKLDSVYYYADIARTISKNSESTFKQYLLSTGYMATALAESGNNIEALNYFNEIILSIELSRTPFEYFRFRQSASTEKALIFMKKTSYDLAMKEYDNFFNYVQSNSIDEKRISSIVYLTITKIKRLQGDINTAFEYAHKALARSKMNRLKHRQILANFFLIYLYIDQDKYDEVSEKLESIYQEIKTREKHSVFFLEYYLLKSMLEERKGNSASQIEYAKKAYNFKQQGNLNKILQAGAILIRAYKKQGNYKKALAIYENNNLLKKKRNINFATINQLSFDNQIKDKEVKSKTIENKAQQRTILIISIILFFALLLVFVGFYLNQNKQKLNNKLKKIDKEKSQFIENISHEISTPITVIKGYLKLINTSASDYNKVIDYTKLAEQNTKFISNNITNFLTLIKLDNVDCPKKHTKEKLGSFLHETFSMFIGIAELKQIEIYYKTNIHKDQKISFDYDSLHKIVNNLVSNAIKYSNSSGTIHIHSYINKSGITITVKDEGIGIPQKEQTKVFNRFFQTNQQNASGGFGIGLSLVKKLVTFLNGSITLESDEGVGSVFTVQLPLNIENYTLYINEKNHQYNLLTSNVSKVVKKEGNLPSILIVDDLIGMTQFIAKALGESFDCKYAFNGKEALEKCQNQNFDLIISDLCMPQMSGFELKQKLNKNKNLGKIPFVMMTSSVKEYFANIDNAPIEINKYLIKPFTVDELLACIRTFIEPSIYQKQLLNNDGLGIHYNGAYSDFIRKVSAIIHDHLNDPNFTIKILAEKCGYSHKQFIHIIKNKTGLSPRKLILEIRLLKAYILITNKRQLSLNEVIYQIGLNSRSYFNKAFETRFGIKPGKLANKKVA
ncbi:sensor histidine kinase TmoS [Kordia sp. SMS9]|uniref:ATP-binding protein n=1 Tax=Kordia sp. SMS9 TaxID=2282170 RepID=UPI000E0DC605|nr:ATP-binding protein [Kordia sp. SMS9]AXG70178.1 sensor histidine kinase TmoS [Kordia sp. SMS9]